MGRHLITAPTEDVVSLAEAKAMLGITNSQSDAMVTLMIKAATQKIDPAGGGWLGRALRPQTWELRLTGFPCDSIELPYPPLISLDSVKYDDGDGVEQTMASTDYRVIAGGNDKSQLLPIYNTSWPSGVRCDQESVRVRFTAGYVSSPDRMPAGIKLAVLLAIQGLWSRVDRDPYLRSESIPGVVSYEWAVGEGASLVIDAALQSLQSTHRVIE